MSRHPETNPHFLARRNDPVIDFSSRQAEPPPRRPPNLSPTPPPIPQNFSPPQTDHDHPPLSQSHQPYRTTSARRHSDHPSLLRLPATSQQKTRPFAWLVAAFCALFWILVIAGGLVILIVYLVFRPRYPKFDISTATFNAAYLDMGYLLNADLTLLANFSNPNTKVNVDFGYAILDLYYQKNFIATRYVEPFAVMKGESRFADVHLIASQVRLSMGHSFRLKKEMVNGSVDFEIKGLFKTRSNLGSFFRYSYWLYSHCQITLAGPPTGILIGKKCVTKR